MIELNELRERLEKSRTAYRIAVDRMIESDGKMQSRYDTQKEEYAREAETIELQIIALEEQVEEIEQLQTPTDNTKVSIGHIVTIEIDGDESEEYLLLEKHSGVQIGNICTLSVASPIGQAILGKTVGSTQIVIVNQNELPVFIAGIRPAQIQAG